MEWVSACPPSTQLAKLKLLPQTQEHTERLNCFTLSLSLVCKMQEAIIMRIVPVINRELKSTPNRPRKRKTLKA